MSTAELKLIGYFPKRRTFRPAYLDASDVMEVCSVSPCIAKPPDGWIEHWTHNDWCLYDSPDEARRVAKAGREGEFDVYAYRLLPVAFEEAPETLEIDGSPVSLTDAFERLGFDVVSRDMATMFECSPLSCNGMAAEVPVNQYCLLSSLQGAEQFARRCAVEQPEPGTYFVVEVWRERAGA